MAEKNQTPETIVVEDVKQPGKIRTFITNHPRLSAAITGGAVVLGGLGAAKALSNRGYNDAVEDMVDAGLVDSTPDSPSEA